MKKLNMLFTLLLVLGLAFSGLVHNVAAGPAVQGTVGCDPSGVLSSLGDINLCNAAVSVRGVPVPGPRSKLQPLTQSA